MSHTYVHCRHTRATDEPITRTHLRIGRFVGARRKCDAEAKGATSSARCAEPPRADRCVVVGEDQLVPVRACSVQRVEQVTACDSRGRVCGAADCDGSVRFLADLELRVRVEHERVLPSARVSRAKPHAHSQRVLRESAGPDPPHVLSAACRRSGGGAAAGNER